MENTKFVNPATETGDSVDYNYIIELVSKLQAGDKDNIYSIKVLNVNHYKIYKEKSTTSQVIFDGNYNRAIDYLKNTIISIDTAYVFIVKHTIPFKTTTTNYYVHKNAAGWTVAQTMSYIPFVRYMSMEDCYKFVEKFANVKTI